MKTATKSFLLYCIFFLFYRINAGSTAETLEQNMYFCTAVDSAFFEDALNLIGSIHRVNYDHIKEVAIFDLGLTKKQKAFLNMIEKVQVYNIELTHPDLLKIFEIGRAGKRARGWYAWKPVVIKQALDMFPHVLYLDAGTVILRPLNHLFKYIISHGYYLPSFAQRSDPTIPSIITIKAHTTKYVIEKFLLNNPEHKWILNAPMIIAGVQGISRSIYSTYIKPIYELTKDLTFFQDDGTCDGGFGQAYSDMSLFSIYAHRLHLDLIPHYSHHIFDAKDFSSNFLLACGYHIPADTSIVYQIRGRLHFSYFIKMKNNLLLKDVKEVLNFSNHY